MYKAHRPGTCCEARKNCEPLICDLEKIGNCWIMLGTETPLRDVSISHEKVHFSAEVHRHGEINPWLAARTLPACLDGARGSQFCSQGTSTFSASEANPTGWLRILLQGQVWAKTEKKKATLWSPQLRGPP